jgi:hypothetical protein
MAMAQVCQNHANDGTCFACGQRIDQNGARALACYQHKDSCVACGGQMWNNGIVVDVCGSNNSCHGATSVRNGACIKCGTRI